MTDVKQLPENLEQLEQLTEFKRVYKKYNVGQLEDLLTEAKVDYLSADLKPDLVWRLLDHRGFDFEAAIALESAPTDAQPEPQDEPALVDEQVNEPAGDKVDTDENVQTVQDDTSDEHGDQSNIEVGTDGDKASADSVEKPDEVVDVTENDAASDIGNINDASANEIEQPAKTNNNPTTNSSASDNKTFVEAPVSEAEFVEVKNNGGFNMLEPATSTLVIAGKTTKIYIKGHATKEQVLGNIAQYNQTRGNKLTVINTSTHKILKPWNGNKLTAID